MHRCFKTRNRRVFLLPVSVILDKTLIYIYVCMFVIHDELRTGRVTARIATGTTRRIDLGRRLLFVERIEIVVQSIAIKKQFFKLISPSSCRIRSNCLVSFVFFFFFLWWRWLFRFDRFGLFPRDSFVPPPLLSQRMEIYLRVKLSKTVFRNVCLLMVGGLGIDTPKVDIKWLLFFESWKFFMVRKLKNIIILISSL